MYKGLPPGIPDLIQVFVRKAQAFQIAPGRAELLPHKGSEAVHALHGSPEHSRVGVGIVLQEQLDLGAQIDVGEGIVGDNVGVLPARPSSSAAVTPVRSLPAVQWNRMPPR